VAREHRLARLDTTRLMAANEPRRGQGRTSLRRGAFTLFYYLIFLPASAAVRHAGDVLHRDSDPNRASYFRILPPRR
jgi:hypothetical protein